VVDRLVVIAPVVDDVIVDVDVVLLYLGRYLIPVVGQLNFAPSIPFCQRYPDPERLLSEESIQ
jgi:hypothetical protein